MAPQIWCLDKLYYIVGSLDFANTIFEWSFGISSEERLLPETKYSFSYTLLFIYLQEEAI